MAARSALTRSLVAWVTSNANGTEHAVTDEQMTAGRTEGSGMYVAQCGLRFVTASMVAPALRRCTDCLLLTTAPTHHRAGPPRGGLLVRWTGWLFRLLWTPVAVSPHPEGGGPASRPDESHSAVTP
jgi:hypothetical protein